MIVCWLFLLIAQRSLAVIDSAVEDYNNDAPDMQPKVIVIKYKIGDEFLMHCRNKHFSKDHITWEFKPCRTKSKSRGFHCTKKNLDTLDFNDNEWIKLDNRKRKKILIKNATDDNSGLYKCLYNGTIDTIYFAEVAVKPISGHPPEITSLGLYNRTGAQHTLECSVTSPVPPQIWWWRVCGLQGCQSPQMRLVHNGTCYCPLPLPVAGWAFNSDSNIYTSKLKVSEGNEGAVTYVCFVMSIFGSTRRNITLPGGRVIGYDESGSSVSYLFLIPMVLVLVPLVILLWFHKSRRKKPQETGEQHRGLIRPVAV